MNHFIRIGGVDHGYSERLCLKNSRGEEVDGTIDHGNSYIEIDQDLSRQMMYQVLWHEILHGIVIQYGIPLEDDGAIDRLAYGIVQVLRDNRMVLMEDLFPPEWKT